MIDSILFALDQGFFLRSLLVVAMLAVIFPLYGNIVAVRKEANIAHTFAHLGLLGVAIGLWFNRSIDLSIFGSVLVTVCFLYFLGESGSQDQVVHNEIGAQLGLVGAILIVSQMSGYKADISSYLFGDILLLGREDVYIIGGIVLVTTIFYLLFQKNRFALSLNRNLAKSKGLSVRGSYLLYLFSLGLLIGGAMKIIGVLLVSAFLILPTNISKFLATNKHQRNLIGMGVCCLTSVSGLFLSWHKDIPSGASIIGLLIVVYLFVVIYGRVTHGK